MNTVVYLLQVNIYLVLFYGFYVLLLQKETFFKLNRIYLVGSVLLSLAIPLIRSGFIQSLFVTQQVRQMTESVTIVLYQSSDVVIHPADQPDPISAATLLPYIYLAGILFCIARLLFQLIVLWRLSKNQSKTNAAYSFFGKIVITGDPEAQATILSHEQVHVKQFHSADILFFEIVAAFNWFNPVVYAFKRAIRHIHEFIADDEAAKSLDSKSDYAVLLVSRAFGVGPNQLTNNFLNKSLLKKRIYMLHKQKSTRVMLAKYGLSAPLFAVMLILSSAALPDEKPISMIADRLHEADMFLFYPSTTVDHDTVPVASLSGVVKSSEGKLLANVKVYNPLSGKTYLTDNQGRFSVPNVRGRNKLWFMSPDFDNTEYTVPVNNTKSPAYPRVTITMKSAQPGKAKLSGIQEIPFDFASVTTVPTFPGGYQVFEKYFSENFKWSAEALSKGLSGRIVAQFIVERDGSLTDIKILKDLGYGTGEEAKRLLSQSPKWKPGIQNGNKVRVAFTLPLVLATAGAPSSGAVSSPQSTPSSGLRTGLADLDGKQPLFLLDGQVISKQLPEGFLLSDEDEQGFGKLVGISPNDIESINIFKNDSALIARYGEKARNGVIAIHTRTTALAFVDTPPTYPGGSTAFARDFQKTFVWPAEALPAAKAGDVVDRVVLSFVVETNGTLTNIKVLKEAGKGTGREAVRTLRALSKWSPGVSRDKGTVRVEMTLPITLATRG